MSIPVCLRSRWIIHSKAVYWRGLSQGHQKNGAAGILPRAPAAPANANEAGVLTKKKLSQIFSRFLKIPVDKSVGVCYYNWAVKSPRSDHKSLQEQRRLLYAGVAQSVEQLICNQQVGGSSPSTSSNVKSTPLRRALVWVTKGLQS